MKFVLQVVAGLLGGVAFAADKPEDFTADGVTGTFADNQLTINVASGKTCTFDYASRVTTGWVTNIVKTGAGAITPAVASAYQGSFDFQAGTVTLNAAGQLGADNVGTVRKASGSKFSTTGTVAKGKRIYLAGTILQSGSSSFAQDCDIVLTGDLAVSSSGGGGDVAAPKGGVLDLNGKTLSFQVKDYWNWVYFNNACFTNSNDSTAATLKANTAGGQGVCFNGTKTTFAGGSRNVFQVPASLFRATVPMESDWTFNFKSSSTLEMKSNNLTFGSMTGIPKITGPATLTITGTWSVNGDALADGSVLNLGTGRFVLASTASINVVKGTKAIPTTPVVVATGGIEDNGANGWHLTSDGVLNVKVSVAVTGEGTVSPTSVCVLPGETATLTATPGAGNYVVWSGDTAAIQSEGHDVFANGITVKVSDTTRLSATFASLADKPEDFSADGVTGTFDDRILTINVASGKTCTYDYSSLVSSGWVTNIVKTGAGGITPAVAAEYSGSFDFRGGSVTLNAVGQLGADNVGIVRKASGSKFITKGVVATGKRIYLAGMVQQEGDYSAFSKDCDIFMTGDATWTSSTFGDCNTPSGGCVDLNGKTLTFQPYSQWDNLIFRTTVYTNSNDSVAATITTGSTGTGVFFSGNTTFAGGSRNVLRTTFGSFQVRVPVDIGWTVDFKSGSTFDMKSQNLSIGSMKGLPTITNPGTLTIPGTWTVGSDVLANGGKLNLGAGSLVFGDNAKIVITRGTKSVKGDTVIASAEGGITGKPVAGEGGLNRKFVVSQSGAELFVQARGLMLVFR